MDAYTIGRTESVLSVCKYLFLFWVEFKSMIMVLLLFQYLLRVSEKRLRVDRSLNCEHQLYLLPWNWDLVSDACELPNVQAP